MKTTYRIRYRLQLMEIMWYVFFLMLYTLGNIFAYNHYVATLGLVCCVVFSQNAEVRFQRSFLPILVYYLLFFIWIFLSWFWATGKTGDEKVIIVSLIEILLMIACMVSYVRDIDRLKKLIQIFVNATALFAIIYYLSSPIKTWGKESMGGFTAIWRNTAGYYFAYAALFAIYMYLMDSEKKTKYNLWIGLFLIIAAIGTGSRKVFVQILLAVSLFTVLQKGIGKKIKMIFTVGIILIVAVGIGIQIPAFQEMYVGRLLSVLDGMTSTDSSTVTRAYMRQYAYELFCEHPIIGAGLNGFTSWLSKNASFLQKWNIHATYSHCNYTELLANAGIIGFALYYLYPIFSVWKARKKYYTPFRRLGMITIFSFIILDYGTISYYIRFYIFILVIGLICLKIEGKEGKGEVSML